MLNSINFHMMRPILLLILVLFTSCSERGKVTNPTDDDNYYTEISGRIFGHLTISNSPYLVTDEIKIDSLQALVIDPGVIIHFTDSSKFLIKGGLTAIGNKDNFIQFTAQVNLWKGIRFINSNQNSVIQFAVIEKVVLSEQDSTEFGAIEINNSTVSIKNCIIRENEGDNGGGIASINSNITIKNNIFRENNALIFGGSLMIIQSNSLIINNTFFNNFCTNCGSAIALVSPLNENIQNNIIFNNLSQTGCSQFYYQFNDSLNYNIEYNFVSLNNPAPEFTSQDDLRLSINSPCIDAGNPDSFYNDIDGTRNDQGAFGGPDGNW
jgi:hypothetical protein